MIKVIKYETIGTFPAARRKGNFLVGESTAPYGPTSTTGFYSGITPPEGGYTLYLAKETQGPSIYVFSNGTELLNFCNTYLSADQTTIFGVIDWINEQNDYFVDPNYFEIVVKTDNSGATSSTQFKLPLISDGAINFTVNWGDNTTNTITSFNQAETTHTYSTAGTYTIKIAGILKGWTFFHSGVKDPLKLLQIKNWGCLNITYNAWGGFYGCSNMTCTAVDAPIISGPFLLYYFTNCTNFNGAVGNWDVSNIYNIAWMFAYTAFNQPLNYWKTGGVGDPQHCFRGNQVFNQDIGSWDMSNAVTMFCMFLDASAFNNGGSPSIGSWNVGSNTSLQSMFQNALAFNQDISNWNVSNISYFNFIMFGKSSANYDVWNLDNIYKKWSQQQVAPNMTANFGSIQYTSGGLAGRNKLTSSPNNWTISDGGIIYILDAIDSSVIGLSLRKIKSSYEGSAITVRRASDNAETNIGFTASGDLDVSSLNSFCSGTDGFVKTWFDQSGGNRSASQTTSANQPQIYKSDSGVVTQNGLPSIEFTGSRTLSGTYAVNGLTQMNITIVGRGTGSGNQASNRGAIFWTESGSWGSVYFGVNQNFALGRFGTGQSSNNIGGSVASTTALRYWNMIKNGSNEYMYVNNSLVTQPTGKNTTITNTNSTYTLNYNSYGCVLSEVLVWNQNKISSLPLLNYELSQYYKI